LCSKDRLQPLSDDRQAVIQPSGWVLGLFNRTAFMTLIPRRSSAQTHAVRAASVLASACLAWLPAQAAASQEPTNVLTLSASATAEAAMDLLSITFSTTREGADAGTVQSQLKQALDAALVEARKVAKPGQVDLRTGPFSLFPRYAPKGGINGWQGTAQLTVEGRDMAAITQLAGRIQTLSIAAVNQGLSREAREKFEADTTAQAIAKFRERAQEHARQFGFAGFVIREVQVSADGAGRPAPMVSAKVRSMAMAADESLPIQAGKAEVTATVQGSVQMLK
jgi:predicted secreted protein